jgi:hypothetical protein
MVHYSFPLNVASIVLFVILTHTSHTTRQKTRESLTQNAQPESEQTLVNSRPFSDLPEDILVVQNQHIPNNNRYRTSVGYNQNTHLPVLAAKFLHLRLAASSGERSLVFSKPHACRLPVASVQAILQP